MAVVDRAVSTNAALSQVDESDFRVEWFSGSGAGGQHRNKHQNSCRVIHIPTGLMEARQGRKREGNLRDAKAALLSTLNIAKHNEVCGAVAADRKNQVGSGMRSDKSITLRFQDDRAIHHLTGKSMAASRYMRGYMDEIWE